MVALQGPRAGLHERDPYPAERLHDVRVEAVDRPLEGEVPVGSDREGEERVGADRRQLGRLHGDRDPDEPFAQQPQAHLGVDDDAEDQLIERRPQPGIAAPPRMVSAQEDVGFLRAPLPWGEPEGTGATADRGDRSARLGPVERQRRDDPQLRVCEPRREVADRRGEDEADEAGPRVVGCDQARQQLRARRIGDPAPRVGGDRGRGEGLAVLKRHAAAQVEGPHAIVARVRPVEREAANGLPRLRRRELAGDERLEDLAGEQLS